MRCDALAFVDILAGCFYASGMRVAVISDIHGNLEALTRVMEAIDAQAPDAIWCLGDVVGYGPDPNGCVDLVRQRAVICLAGNHDLAVVGKIPISHFNPVAREAILWHRAHLSPDRQDWLASLPTRLDMPEVTLAHGSPRDPIWEYVVSPEIAAANMDAFTTPIGLVGHSHVPLAWRLERTSRGVQVTQEGAEPGEPLPLDEQGKWLLNPGSVGQPRDHDPRAAFAVLDTVARTWTWYRVAYDVSVVEQAILASGLPEVLGRRLYLGW